MTKYPIGIDERGHIRFRRSKKNPIYAISGTFQIGDLDTITVTISNGKMTVSS